MRRGLPGPGFAGRGGGANQVEHPRCVRRGRRCPAGAILAWRLKRSARRRAR